MIDMTRSTVDIQALTQFLNSIQSYSEYLVQSVTPGQLFYHYTDLNALSSIVSRHDLWLTNSRYSNDDDEITFGYTVAKRVIDQEQRSAKRKRPKDDRRIEFLEALASLIEKPPPEGFYICCFCEKDNLLSQWRSYGANGTGVSLGFDPMEFTRITGQDMPLGLMRLWKVFYKTTVQERIVHAAIDYVCGLGNRLSVEGMARQAADAIQFFVPTFKNEDFDEEKERRLIFTPDPTCPLKPHYRVARGMLVPYYSMCDLVSHVYGGVQPLPLRSVMIGPSVQKKLNAESTQMLLWQNDYRDVTVRESDTPYRG